ncbi:MAG: pilin [Candidatus Woesebacteria bacterium]|jgi:hypothetical protein
MKSILSAIKITASTIFMLLLLATPASAQVSEQAICEGSGGTYSGGRCVTDGRTVTGTIQQITNILVFMVGAVSVIMIIIGGIRYAVSNGDQSAVTGAKNTILYAVIGLVVAFMAYAIVNFVLNSLGVG